MMERILCYVCELAFEQGRMIDVSELLKKKSYTKLELEHHIQHDHSLIDVVKAMVELNFAIFYKHVEDEDNAK